MRIFWAVLRHVFKNSAGNTIADVFPEDIEIRDFSVKGYKKQRLSTYDWKVLLDITLLNTFPFQLSVNQ